VQALRRAVPLLHWRQLEAFRERFFQGHGDFRLEELILAALSDPALQASVREAEAEAAKRAKPKPAGKGKHRSTSRSGAAPE
jgi:hypothetical protein